MSYRKPLIGLSLFLVLAIVVTWMVYRTLDRGISGSTHSYSATFTDVSGLHEGDDVRVAGVRVGRVDTVELDGTHAKVTFEVQKDQQLYTDTKASVSASMSCSAALSLATPSWYFPALHSPAPVSRAAIALV